MSKPALPGAGDSYDPVLRERKGDVRVTRFRAQLTATRRDDNVLPPSDRKSAGRRITSRRQRCFPQQLTGRLVERAEFCVHRGGDKDETARRDDRSAVLLRSRGNTALPCQRGMLAERNSPAVLAGVEIDRAQRAPW